MGRVDYRQDAAKRQTAGIKFNLSPKFRFFAPHAGATRCTDSRQTWQGRPAPGSACLCKIWSEWPQEVGMRPQNIKKIHFLVKSRPAGATPLTDFENFRVFYTTIYLALVFQISYVSH